MRAIRIAGLLLSLALTAPTDPARAASPITPPASAPSPVPMDPLPALAPGCRRMASEDHSATVARATSRDESGTCDAASDAETQRQITESRLDCLMNGYEGSFDLRISCTKVARRTDQGIRLQLKIESRWRCYRAQCPGTK